MEIDVSSIVSTGLSYVTRILSDGDVRNFWIYMISGILIAVVAHRLSGDRRSFTTVFFARDVWASRSAVNDYAMLVLNPLLLVTVSSFLFAWVQPLTVLIAVPFRMAGATATGLDGAGAVVAVIFSLALYISNDFGRWYTHYMFHRSPLLWEFHKVHHSAEHLNFATTERVHPVETLITGFIVIGIATVVNGIFLGLFGASLTPLTAAGANVFWIGSNLIGGVLRHSPAWVSYGPRVERWLISPAMHQLHHSEDSRHFDKNMGGSLAIWDRIAGTLYIPKGREVTSFGIGAETAEYRSIRAIYLLPFRKVFARLRKRSAKRRARA